MKNKRLIIIVLLVIPILSFSQVPDTSKLSTKDNLLSIKLYNESLGLFNQQKQLEAITMLNKAIALNPKFAKAYYNRGCYRLQSHSLDDAIEDFTQLIKLEPGSKGYMGRGYTYLLKKEYQKAIEDLSVAVLNDPKNANAFYYRGSVYTQQEKYTQALADFDKAIELQTNYAIAYNDRGSVKIKMKDFTAAKTDLIKAVTFDPGPCHCL